MLYCHSRGVVHRDLKLENVLFKNDPEDDLLVKVVDFGIAGVANDKVDAGTLCYMAPECLERVAAQTSPAIDVWAIGVMFYTMIYGRLPFYAEGEKELTKLIKNEQPKFTRDIPITPEGKEIIKTMLSKEASKRLELLEYVKMNYFSMDEEDFEANYNAVVKLYQDNNKKPVEEEVKLEVNLDLEEEKVKKVAAKKKKKKNA